MDRGKFIVLEGIEGSGKTLQTNLLYEHLKSKGIRVHKTKEATDGPIGKLIHQEYLSGKRKADDRILNLLYVVDRLDHLTNSEDGILTFINNGISVISDRYYLSSAAYHASFFSSKASYWSEMKDIIDRNKINRDLLKPDLTILLSVNSTVAYERVSARNQPKEIFDNIDSLRNLSYCYRDAGNFLSGLGDYIITIDGNRDPASVRDTINKNVDCLFTELSDVDEKEGNLWL